MRPVAATLLLATALVAGCSSPDERGVVLPELPGDVAPADFPGVSYPLASGPPTLPSPRSGPVVLIGIDAATWDLILPLVDDGRLPAFASLLSTGAHGVLLSEEPMLSAALWTTIATGVPRFVHGINDFVVKVPGRNREILPGPPNRHAPALWNLVGAAGGRSAVVGWYASFPAERIAGVYLSQDLDPADPQPGQVEPPELAAAIRQRAVVVLPDELVAKIAKSHFLHDALLRDAKAMAAFHAVAFAQPADLVAVYLPGLDVVQHLAWRHMDPASQQFPQDGPPDPALAEIIPAYYELVDGFVAHIVAMAPADATVVVLSDHGAGALQPEEAYHFQTDVLLRLLGLGGDDSATLLTCGQLYRNDKDLWLNLVGVEEAGTVPLERASETAAAVAVRLRALTCADGRPLLAAVVDHTATAGWQPGRPALTIRFAPEALATPTVTDGATILDFAPVRFRQRDVSGNHRREGIIIVKGPAVRPGRLSSPATLYNIAPTVLYLLGLPQDGNMLRFAPAGGGVLTAAIDPAFLAGRPVTMVPSYPASDATACPLPTAVDIPAEAETMERLRALGYLR